MPATWIAQAAAGLSYDSTWGCNDRPGPRSGLALPFFAFDNSRRQDLQILELPLTIMDGTLFRRMGLRADGAYQVAKSVIMDARDHEGLVTLLWHNNFFAEPEYSDWEEVYERLLDLVASEGATVMTAAEIDRWWRARARVRFLTIEWKTGFWSGTLDTSEVIENVAVEVLSPRSTPLVSVEGAVSELLLRAGSWKVVFPRLVPGNPVRISVQD